MARKAAASAIGDQSKRRRDSRQMDQFKSTGAQASADEPAWPDLPENARNALVSLMAQLMLEHAQMSAAPEAGYDR
jgi:hypothetical protein